MLSLKYAFFPFSSFGYCLYHPHEIWKCLSFFFSYVFPNLSWTNLSKLWNTDKKIKSSSYWDHSLHYTCQQRHTWQKNQRKIYGYFNPITLRKAKIVYNFSLSECNRVKCKIFNGVQYINTKLYRRVSSLKHSLEFSQTSYLLLSSSFCLQDRHTDIPSYYCQTDPKLTLSNWCRMIYESFLW